MTDTDTVTQAEKALLSHLIVKLDDWSLCIDGDEITLLNEAGEQISYAKLPETAFASLQVPESVYKSAVKGRQDFRQAYRDLLPVQRAAAALCLLYRAPQHPFQVSDQFIQALDALDVATCGGGKSSVARPTLEALTGDAAREEARAHGADTFNGEPL